MPDAWYDAPAMTPPTTHTNTHTHTQPLHLIRLHSACGDTHKWWCLTNSMKDERGEQRGECGRIPPSGVGPTFFSLPAVILLLLLRLQTRLDPCHLLIFLFLFYWKKERACMLISSRSHFPWPPRCSHGLHVWSCAWKPHADAWVCVCVCMGTLINSRKCPSCVCALLFFSHLWPQRVCATGDSLRIPANQGQQLCSTLQDPGCVDCLCGGLTPTVGTC